MNPNTGRSTHPLQRRSPHVPRSRHATTDAYTASLLISYSLIMFGCNTSDQPVDAPPRRFDVLLDDACEGDREIMSAYQVDNGFVLLCGDINNDRRSTSLFDSTNRPEVAQCYTMIALYSFAER